LQDYEDMLRIQNGVCAICGGVNSNGENLSIDHDHNCCPTVKSCGSCIRGLLCGDCNRGIGLLKDSIENIRRAESYLAWYAKLSNKDFPDEPFN
jgi:hypothetical protein